jgi:hypothetical protein
MGCKNIFLKTKKKEIPQTFGSLRAFGPPFRPLYQNHSLHFSKKEDIKMDD